MQNRMVKVCPGGRIGERCQRAIAHGLRTPPPAFSDALQIFEIDDADDEDVLLWPPLIAASAFRDQAPSSTRERCTPVYAMWSSRPVLVDIWRSLLCERSISSIKFLKSTVPVSCISALE